MKASNGLRWGTALLLAVAAAALPVITPGSAGAAVIRFNTTNQAIPLLLIHGFNDDCGTAWNTQGYKSDNNTPLPAPNTDARSYLGGQYADIKEIGYYTSTARNTDNRDATGGWCDENLNSDSNPDLKQCDAISTDGSEYGTKDDHIDRLACLLAWYIYDTYTQYGEPVNVLAHSMGGLLIRYALGATAARAAHFPPVLWVNNVVTVATPHGGIYGPYYSGASMNNNTNGVELDMMNPGDSRYAFMKTIGSYSKPQGYDGTRWALIGAFDGAYADITPPGGTPPDGGNVVSFSAWNLGGDENSDGVVPSDSQFAMTADYKVGYGVQHESNDPSDVADWNTQYEHETLIGCFSIVLRQACFNGPFYLNDSSTAPTKAWTCSGCGGDPGGSPVTVSRSLVTIAAQLHQKAVPNLPSFDLVLRSNANHNYVSAELGYTGASYGMLRARSATKGPWESWTQVQLPTGHWLIRNNANDQYVSAELTDTGSNQNELRARTPASAIGPYEVFDIVNNPDGTYSLRSLAAGQYVSAELGYTGSSYGELRARSSSVGPWEKYTTDTSPVGCTNYGGATITGPNSCAGTFSAHSTWFPGGGVGLFGQEIWTYANGNVQDSTATYQLSGLDTIHVMQIQAYIPNNHADASNARYQLCSPGVPCVDGFVNQNSFANQWAVVGAVCTTDGTATVTLADNGGDQYPAQIGADAIRAVRLGLVC